MLMAVDLPPSPRHENTEASLSWGMSSLGKCFRYEGSNAPYPDPDYEQEGAVRGSCPFNFNDSSDNDLTDDNMPDMMQVIEGQPSWLSAQLLWLHTQQLQPQASHL
jgi:hypothetical protein